MLFSLLLLLTANYNNSQNIFYFINLNSIVSGFEYKLSDICCTICYPQSHRQLTIESRMTFFTFLFQLFRNWKLFVEVEKHKKMKARDRSKAEFNLPFSLC